MWCLPNSTRVAGWAWGGTQGKLSQEGEDKDIQARSSTPSGYSSPGVYCHPNQGTSEKKRMLLRITTRSWALTRMSWANQQA